jgi:hypothetical protein
MADRIDELYALPLDEFTAARNRLAAELKSEDAEASKRVKALTKPNATAWVLNRLVRVARRDVEEFLEVGERVRSAEADALRGKGAHALRDAADEERRAADVVVRRAEILAREAGIGVTQALSQKIGDTLRAAVVDSEARDLLLRGRLTTDLRRVGFGIAKPVRVAEPKEPVQDEGLVKASRAASQDVERLSKAVRNAERAAERLAREASEAAERAKAAKVKLAELRREHREAERAFERAQKALEKE